MNQILRAFLADRLVQVSLAIHTAAAAVFVLAALVPSTGVATLEAFIDPALLTLTFAMLLAGAKKIERVRELRFWQLLAAAWLCWLMVEFFYFTEFPLPFVSASFATDLLFVLFYLCVALGVELKPHLPTQPTPARLRVRLETVAGLLGVFGLIIYFGLVNLPEPLGLSLSFVSRERGLVPYLLVQVGLCLVLATRFAYASHTSRGRWRGLYLLFAFAFLCYAARNGTLLLQAQERIPGSALGLGWHFFLLLPGLTVILAARYRHLPLEDTSQDHVMSAEAEEVFRSNPLALYMLVVPVAHFILYPLGLLEESSRGPREVFSLIYLLVIGVISAIHQLVIEKQRHQALGALKQEIANRRRINRELEARQAEMEQFSYTISHELKAPLVTIIGFSGFLERELGSGEEKRVRADLEKIRAAATDMRQLLAELLELSRVGWVIERQDNVSMTVAAESASEKLVMRTGENEPKVFIDPAMPVVEADPARIEDVFKNLLTNAIKFRRSECPTKISIGCRSEAEPVFYVSDNGRGIDPRYHDRIFGLFDRFHPEIEGTGVGLALVKRIIDKHGGRVWVESEGEGTGSTFCFTVPRPGGHSGRTRAGAGRS